jgi:hypothetical protein
MDETNPATDATRIGVESLTLWLQSDRQRAVDHIANLELDPGGPGATTIIVGLLNLSAWLVLTLAKERGAATDDELRDKAGDILRDFSRQLPE